VSGKRIQRAKELIISTDEDLETIAEKCGYTNAMTFRRNFKEMTGLIPSRFREEQRMQH
jgi:transcriptional regulator GlxA family with amidase domain